MSCNFVNFVLIGDTDVVASPADDDKALAAAKAAAYVGCKFAQVEPVSEAVIVEADPDKPLPANMLARKLIGYANAAKI